MEYKFQKEKPYVFISYSRKFEKYVKRDLAELRREGVNCWIDKENIPPGVDWDKDIVIPAIKNKNCMAVLFYASLPSLKRDPCFIELETAKNSFDAYTEETIDNELDHDKHQEIKEKARKIIPINLMTKEIDAVIEDILSSETDTTITERVKKNLKYLKEYRLMRGRVRYKDSEEKPLEHLHKDLGVLKTLRDFLPDNVFLVPDSKGASTTETPTPVTPPTPTPGPVIETPVVAPVHTPTSKPEHPQPSPVTPPSPQPDYHADKLWDPPTDKKAKDYVSWKESRIILKGFSEPYDKISKKASDNYRELVELILNEYPDKIDEVVRELRSISTDEFWEHRKGLAYYGGKPHECFLNGIRLRIGTGINDKAKTKNINDILKIVDGSKFYNSDISFSVEEITQGTTPTLTPKPVIETPVATPVHNTPTSKPEQARTQDHTPSFEGQELIRKLYNDLVVDKKIDTNDKSKYGKESQSERENHNVRSDVFTNGKLSGVRITQGKGQGLHLYFVGFEIYLSVGRVGDKVKFPNDGVAIWRKGEKAQLIVKRNESKEVQQVLDNYDDEREKLFANINEYIKKYLKYREHTQPPPVSPPQSPVSPVEAALIGYPFELYGNSYAEKNQSKAMAKIYEAVLNQHKEKLTKVEKEQNIVSFDSESKRGPKYTTIGIKVNATDVYIDVTLDVNIKIKRILKLFEIVGDDVAEVLKVK